MRRLQRVPCLGGGACGHHERSTLRRLTLPPAFLQNRRPTGKHHTHCLIIVPKHWFLLECSCAKIKTKTNPETRISIRLDNTCDEWTKYYIKGLVQWFFRQAVFPEQPKPLVTVFIFIFVLAQERAIYKYSPWTEFYHAACKVIV